MFTGLIQEKGTVLQMKGTTLVIQLRSKPKMGESIAINGVCLTVSKIAQKTATFDLSRETLMKTSLKQLPKGSKVNVEKALKASDVLGGHMVQGHVDAVGRVSKIESEKGMKNIFFDAPKDVMTYVVPKGSITVDGVSLTAVRVTKNGFSVALIPVTLRDTTLGELQKNDRVNLEADIIGKYVKKFLHKK